MPVVNVITKEMFAKRNAALRARASLITHCPRGHVYDVNNTYTNNANKRICRACNAARVSAIYSMETESQRETRRRRAHQYSSTNEIQRAKRYTYALAHKDEKRAYDRTRRERLRQSVNVG